MERKRKTQSHFCPPTRKMWQGTMVDVCDTFCGVETFAAALEMDQMDQMNQSALEPPKKWLKMFGVAGPNYIVFDPDEWFRFMGCRYGQPRIGYQPSKMGIGNWKPPYNPHLMSAPPPSSSSSPVSNLSISLPILLRDFMGDTPFSKT